MSANGISRIRWRWVVLTRARRTRRVSACEKILWQRRACGGDVDHRLKKYTPVYMYSG